MKLRHADRSSSLVLRSVSGAACVLLGGLLSGVLSGCGSVSGAPTGQTPTASSTGPQLGYAWRASDSTLRPILGVPGGAQFGQSVVAAGEYVAAAASPAENRALLVGTDGSLSQMPLPNGTVAALGVNVGAAAQIRFSPLGKAALVFTPNATAATLVTDLSGKGSVKQVTLPGGVLEGAVSDAGTLVAVVSSGVGIAAEVVSATGAAQPLVTAGKLGGLSFVSAADDLLLADAAANTLVRVSAVSTRPAVSAVTTAGLLSAPAGVGVSADGQWAVVANSGNAGIVRVSLTAPATPQALVCACQPALVAALSGGAFRFTELTDGPVWIADVSAAQPKMLFIPGLGTGAATSAQAGVGVSR